MSRYSNILTMILIALIVAIMGIIGYFLYDTFKTGEIETNANTAVAEFTNSTKTIKKKKSTKNETSSDTVSNLSLDELANMVAEDTNTNIEETTTTEEEEVEKTYYEGYEVKGIINIPKTGIEYPVLESVTKKSLEVAVGIAYGPGLNKVGNTCIYGHNYRNGKFFSDNKKLSKGDKVLITDQSGETVTYIIYNIYQTDPNDASYMTRDTNGAREISLQTCTDDSSARIIIWAAEEGSAVLNGN